MSPETALAKKKAIRPLVIGRCGMYVLPSVRQSVAPKRDLRTCASLCFGACNGPRSSFSCGVADDSALFALCPPPHVCYRACSTAHRAPTFIQRLAQRHGAVCRASKPKDAHWIPWRCMTCSQKDITADDNTDFEDISRYDVGMLPLLTRPCTSRLISRLDSCLRLVTLRLVLGLAHVRKSTLPSRHFSLAPPPPMRSRSVS